MCVCLFIVRIASIIEDNGNTDVSDWIRERCWIIIVTRIKMIRRISKYLWYYGGSAYTVLHMNINH